MNTKFDFIIVGAGSAGCVLASRLTENPDVQVLVLEAGRRDVPEGVNDPLDFASMFGSPIDWNYATIPQPGLGGQMTQQPRGKLLGGTSNLYGMMHMRCPAADFDTWANTGAPGWGYADVLRYFRRLEDQEDKTRPDSVHGGTLPLTSPRLHDHSMVWVNGRLRKSASERFTNFETALFLKSDPGRRTSDLEVVCMTSSFKDIAARRLPGSIDLVAAVVQPQSRGWVRLASTNPMDPPLIHPNYLGDPVDLERQVQIVRVARELFQTKALSEWISEETSPGADIQSDDQLREHVRAQALPQWHIAGSCRMGLDEKAVVDPSLRVHNVKSLRVVDSSVFPAIPSGHCHAAVLMIAERASDLIKAAHGLL